MSAVPQCEKIARNKHWEEMNDPEKIAALRETVVWLARDLKAANAALTALGHHQHAADGKLMAPLYTSVGGNLNEGGYSPNYAHNLLTERERGRLSLIDA